MKTVKPLPTTRAKNAYTLLAAVCRLITAEPRRYNQGLYLTKGKPGTKVFENTDSQERYPACGTVGCVAGWVKALIEPETLTEDNNIRWTAANILGLQGMQTQELFTHQALLYLPEATNKTLNKPQSAAYAKLGVLHIRRFMEKYAEQLKAKEI